MTSFPRFVDLPLEIRQLIRIASINDSSREVSIKSIAPSTTWVPTPSQRARAGRGTRYTHGWGRFTSSSEIPPWLLVDRESRCECIAYYKRCFRAPLHIYVDHDDINREDTGGCPNVKWPTTQDCIQPGISTGIWLNPETDTVCVSITDVELISKEDSARILRLRIVWEELDFEDTSWVSAVSQYVNLQKLDILLDLDFLSDQSMLEELITEIVELTSVITGEQDDPVDEGIYLPQLQITVTWRERGLVLGQRIGREKWQINSKILDGFSPLTTELSITNYTGDVVGQLLPF